MSTKTCSACKVVKPLDAFYPRKPRSRGLRPVMNPDQRVSQCKACNSRIKRETKSREAASNKVCGDCKCDKPADEFSKNICTLDGLNSRCKTCMKQRWRNMRAKNPEMVLRRQRSSNLRRCYGITNDGYNQRYVDQNGGCAICKSTNPGGGNLHFAVDHDHATGTVRGLLCSCCNTGLGFFKDNAALLLRAVDYLRSSTEC